MRVWMSETTRPDIWWSRNRPTTMLKFIIVKYIVACARKSFYEGNTVDIPCISYLMTLNGKLPPSPQTWEYIRWLGTLCQIWKEFWHIPLTNHDITKETMRSILHLSTIVNRIKTCSYYFVLLNWHFVKFLGGKVVDLNHWDFSFLFKFSAHSEIV